MNTNSTRTSSMVQRVEKTTCSGKTTIYIYAGVMNYMTLVHAYRSKNQLACWCVFICYHLTREAQFVWVDMQMRVENYGKHKVKIEPFIRHRSPRRSLRASVSHKRFYLASNLYINTRGWSSWSATGFVEFLSIINTNTCIYTRTHNLHITSHLCNPLCGVLLSLVFTSYVQGLEHYVNWQLIINTLINTSQSTMQQFWSLCLFLRNFLNTNMSHFIEFGQH